MQQPAPAPLALPDYASMPGIESVARRLGVTTKLVNRWIVRGIKTESGKVRLRAVKIGWRWKVDPAWVAEFVAAMTAAALPASATPPGSGAFPIPLEPTRTRGDGEDARVSAVIDRLRGRGIAKPSQKRRRVAPTS